MKRKLYYTIEKQTQSYGYNEEFNGWKTITVYEITNDQPKMFCEIEASNWDSAEDEIQEWLGNNGFEEREYEFINL